MIIQMDEITIGGSKFKKIRGLLNWGLGSQGMLLSLLDSGSS